MIITLLPAFRRADFKFVLASAKTPQRAETTFHVWTSTYEREKPTPPTPSGAWRLHCAPMPTAGRRGEK